MKKDTRRSFITKFSAVLGGLGLLTTSVVAATSAAMNKEHLVFLDEYAQWVSEYKEVVEKEKFVNDDIDNKRKIMTLSDQASAWKDQLPTLLENKEFSKEYFSLSKDFASCITQELEA